MKALSLRDLLAYGLFGLPLALVALPIHVLVPQFYAGRFGLPLAAIGAALLIARVVDAFIDPAIGAWIDRTERRGMPIVLALPALIAGFLALFHPPAAAHAMPFAWFVAALLVVYGGFSIATIAHQSWGAALAGIPAQRTRITAVREACALAGVVLAAVLPHWAGPGWLSALFVAALPLAAAALLWHAPRPAPVLARRSDPTAWHEPFRNGRFRWLFAVFVVNGVAAAIPATLFLFFAGDRLRLPQYAGLFLVLYFVAAALSMPLWVSLARHVGEARGWLVGMLIAVASFVWAYSLGPGAVIGFGAICAISGIALGADLALPPALLAGVIADGGHSGRLEGRYFGAWNWATKMNLALAAGIALPLLETLGFTPGTTDADGLHALALAYAVLPCLLKLAAAALLWRAPLRDI